MAADILDRIVAHKKDEVAACRTQTPLSVLKDQARTKTANRRSFYEALARPADQVRIIAEIKRASPSKGDISADLDPAGLAQAYERGGAAALSVLTDRAFFKGGPADLLAARNACSLPVLRKDFVISDYQIYEAAAWDADAVLLIVRILSKQQLSEFSGLCNELGIDALVEVHTESDLAAAMDVGAAVIGINNRNLASFDTDIETAMSLSAKLGAGQIAVAASGISSRKDIEQNLKAGISRFLIGESLVTADDPEKFLTRLIGG
ncbi:indole-3-glycerol phosphate synthase [Desulfosalsimonas propionicica]|uniref:Indole-3-glycerol phosphate synthase n=1 Tax=Desulfosalsimonas propionicica TaxID=332175 RepID=A0A7W0C816_9BACT|nr:indole-3-glycerol phosphate synthase TrpC [Desulfosalsimonas propionicica]MBA2880889.1 indole-3-glycerol phosphate synthase [Desulfosalsimonas propionicica]